jgi:acetyltransferase-like isoleucine patch superfamily enzyme
MNVTKIASPLLHALGLGTRVTCRIRGLWIKLRLEAAGGHVGKRLSVSRGVRIITAPGANWYIGDRVSLMMGAIISVSKGASLYLGHDVQIGYFVVIGVEDSMSIGDRAGVAEHSSVRDHDHDSSTRSFLAAPVVCSPVTIGEEAWICRGAAVLRGSRVGPGAIIGANAVVRGEIPPDAIAVGIPARVVRIREPATYGSNTPASRTGREGFFRNRLSHSSQSASEPIRNQP